MSRYLREEWLQDVLQIEHGHDTRNIDERAVEAIKTEEKIETQAGCGSLEPTLLATRVSKTVHTSSSVQHPPPKRPATGHDFDMR